MTSDTQQKAIVVYGASSEHIDPAYKEAAYELGRLIALSDIAVVCGGGRAGLMKAAIEGAVEAGGCAIGVLPQFMVDRQWQHPRLTRMVATPDMHSRKSAMAGMSMAAIACPGGCGTFEELLEMITWRQLGLYHGPVVILNTAGYYDPLIEMLDRSIEQGFRRGDHRQLWHVADTPAMALELALAADDNPVIPQQNL